MRKQKDITSLKDQLKETQDKISALKKTIADKENKLFIQIRKEKRLIDTIKDLTQSVEEKTNELREEIQHVKLNYPEGRGKEMKLQLLVQKGLKLDKGFST